MQPRQTRRSFLQFGAATALACAFTSVRAQAAWPNRPLRIIIPFAAGGSSDFIARLISNPLGEALGVNVIVDNRPGNAGNLGAAIVATANDQHTVMLSDTGSLAISPLVTPNLNFKLNQLAGVSMLGYSPHLLVLHPNVPASNLRELVELSKKKPINVASAGSGSPNHLGVVEIALATGMRWQHVPYKGGAQALADTAAGNTDAVLNGMLATLPLVQAGKLKAIAVSKRTRVPLLPNLATVAEQGVTNFESGTYQGVIAPSTQPKAQLEKLNAALIKVIRTPELRARMLEAGAEVSTSTSAGLDEFITQEAKRWGSVIKRAGKNIEGAA
jgi:tripartite-type tricarboxylate transporter receptor subunit TctC